MAHHGPEKFWGITGTMKAILRVMERDSGLDPILVACLCINPDNLRTETLFGEKLLNIVEKYVGCDPDNLDDVLIEVGRVFYPLLCDPEVSQVYFALLCDPDQVSQILN